MKHRHLLLTTATVTLLTVAFSNAAFAQNKQTDPNAKYNTALAVDNFDPLPAQGSNILNTAKSDIPSFLHAGLFIHAFGDSLVQRGVNPETKKNEAKYKIHQYQARAELSLGWGFLDAVDIGLVVPIVLYQHAWMPKGPDNGEPDTFAPGGPFGSLTGDLAKQGEFGKKGAEKAGGDAGKGGWLAGDMQVVLKLAYPERFAGVGFGLLARVYLPILNGINKSAPYNSYALDEGTYKDKDGKEQKTSFADGIRGEARLIVDWKHEGTGIDIAANIGYQYRPTRYYGSAYMSQALLWNLGLEVPFGFAGADWFALLGNVWGQYSFTNEDIKSTVNSVFGSSSQSKDKKAEDPFSIKYTPIEWDLAAQFRVSDMVMQIGGGGSAGPSAPFSPFWRAFLSVGYTPMMQDSDGDGVPDDRDQCPDEPEDRDGFQDEDGCPDPDNDGDGIFDIDDNCPNEAGPLANQGCPWGDRDGDGVPDNVDNCPDEAGDPANNGCPITDRDGDGIPDHLDKCPDEPEDKDGFEDEDGCPDLDNDGDGIPDTEDECPNEKGPKATKGCPPKDRDGDGIPDHLDKCPDEPETINGIDDEDGCPDKGKTKVRVTSTKIEILEKVFFATGKATIRRRSYNLLDQVASVLKNNQKITKIRIEGYTDSRGSDSFNLRLSQDRADSVRQYLIDRGVSPSRLQAKGFGEENPIDSNKTRAGRERNRRVEFTITEVDGKPVSTNSVTIQEKEIID